MTVSAGPRTRIEPGELDEVTLRRAQRGDQTAARALVVRYQRPVFALLSRLLGPAGRRALVEDLAQETFLRAFRALPTFRPGAEARLSTWLLTIATRLALDELRRRRPPAAPLDQIPAPAPGAAADLAAERRQLGRAIERAVQALRPEYRAAFLLREVHELEYEEIARALGVDLGTVKSRLARARQALRQALAEVHHG
jgi:RNA polymerase sigma-70 factor (ECF subfamily)